MLEIGTRVTILYPDPANPRTGVIYDYIPYKWWPYHVQPDGWREDKAGIACTEAELIPIATMQQKATESVSS